MKCPSFVLAPVLAATLVGCGYGVKIDDEGVDINMPGQRIKTGKDGVEIDQAGLQKIKAGPDGVDIQQPGQRIRTGPNGVQIDQGKQQLKVEGPPGRGSKGRLSSSDEVPEDQKGFSGLMITTLDLSERDLAGADFSNTRLIQVNFSGCNLSGADFTNSEMIQCNFTEANASAAKFDKVEIRQGHFGKTDFTGASFKSAELVAMDLKTATLEEADFQDAKERGVQR